MSAEPFSAADAVAWTDGVLLHGARSATLAGVSIDTRTVGAGECFVAIRGPHHDAHAFLADALARGAAGLVVERDRGPADPGSAVVIEVTDTTQALSDLARGHRARFDGPLVAITGSNGKTTTKEMCAEILAVSGPCGFTKGNLNNAFGVPLTLLRRCRDDRTLVIEIGMNHRGEIAPLAALARPTVVLLTNVGTAHIENLASQDEIAREKGDLVAALTPDGVAVLNAEDPHVMAQRTRSSARVVTYGAGGDVRAENARARGDAGHAFTLLAPAGRVEIEIAGLAQTTVLNALGAAAAALEAGASLANVAEGLRRWRAPGGRMSPQRLRDDVLLLDDTYNANPQSMEVALRSLAELKGTQRALAVLGDMGELGHTTRDAHRAIGRLVAQLGLDLLFTLGSNAHEIAAGAREAGMQNARVHESDAVDETAAHVGKALRAHDRVLVKGSRSMRMERIVTALCASQGEA
jgi:UDP-N-acetylmuramoyl-tripeptide--D-alanyl-D-alanine ligase